MGTVKKNVMASYISQIYLILTSLGVLPLYIKYMGSEAYGLVGFFSMLQAWFVILDLGLTPTISREASRFNAKATSPIEFCNLFNSLRVIFIFVALVGSGIMFISSGLIASKWLSFDSLTGYEVIISIQVMSICVGLRWMTGLYRGIISGFERLVWLSFYTILINTLRFFGVFISMYIFGFTPSTFFVHQLIVAILELAIIYFYAMNLIPKIDGKYSFSLKPIKKLLTFSLTIALTTTIWIFITQIDKFILSGILSLKYYGYFTLAVLIANGVLQISGPISTAIMPRMAKLNAENKHKEMIEVYRQSTKFVSAVSGCVSLSLITIGPLLLKIWTGDYDMPDDTGKILQLYVAGNFLLSISGFAYYLQYSKGNLRYHLIGNIILAILLVPLIIYFANKYGAIGSGYVWLAMNTFYLFIWVAYVHHKIEPGLHLKWIVNDCIKVIAPAIVIVTTVLSYISDINYSLLSRMEGVFVIILVSISISLITIFASSEIRNYLFKNMRPKFKW